MKATVSELAGMLPGARAFGEASFDGVGIDSRTLRPGSLFAAITGKVQRGEEFLEEALRSKADAALVSSDAAVEECKRLGLACVQVESVIEAIQQLAIQWRKLFHGEVIAVSGANGKTTVAGMCAGILREEWGGDRVHSTRGNSNNCLGAPLTVLGLRHWHMAAVVELGVSEPGDMDLLARVCAPTIALVNNAQREHMEFFGSAEGSAYENAKIFTSLKAGSLAVMPGSCDQKLILVDACDGKVVKTFGQDEGSDARIQGVWNADDQRWQAQLDLGADGKVCFDLKMPGKHNLANASAAALCARAAGASMESVRLGLDGFKAVAGRSSLERLSFKGSPAWLIDDTYNANPDSVEAAIEQLATLPSPRWLILGDMAEVGSSGKQEHAMVLAKAKDAGIDWVWTAGELCSGLGAHKDHADAMELIDQLEDAPQARSILVKGSRSMGMERVVWALRSGLNP